MIRRPPRSTLCPSIWSHFMANPAIVVMTLIFVVGHLAGTAMLGIALWRVLAVRLWAASAIVAGDLGHPVAPTIGSPGLDLPAFGLPPPRPLPAAPPLPP